MSSPPPFIRVRAVRVQVAASPDSAKQSKSLIWGSLHIGPRRHILIEDGNGALCQDFLSVVEFSQDTNIELRYKTTSWTRKRWVKAEINTRKLFENFSANETEVVHHMNGIQVVFSRSDVHPLPPLPSTIQTIQEYCPHFRLLVIGKTGVGKSTLIRTAFGIDEAHSSEFQPGDADIEKELKSDVNKWLILHDSCGFEPGEEENFETVKRFIQSRRNGPIKDQLHAIWYCVTTPRAGSRLEAAAEEFFQKKEELVDSVPMIVVYTKLDEAVNEEFLSIRDQLGEESSMDRARLDAESNARRQHDEINKLAKEVLPYEVVSTNEGYKETVQPLVLHTYEQVGRHHASQSQTSTGVPFIAAQRIDPCLKVKGTIDVGKQKYWRALGTSTYFDGRSMWDCLFVIHADVVDVWNFNDPKDHLSHDKFKELVVKMVREMRTSPVRRLSKTLLAGSSLTAVVSVALVATSNPAGPIVLPVIASVVLLVWLFDVYQSSKNVQQMFIAYIVDLTHVMRTLSILTGRENKRLTRRAIKLAYRIYYDSKVMPQMHRHIQTYREDGRDAALNMIESLIKPEKCGDSNMRDYYAQMDALELGPHRLDQEEEWGFS